MAINRASKVTKKPTSAAAANEGSSSAAMAAAPPDHTQPSPSPWLPPGVYFNPTLDECLGFLNRWIAGEADMPDARGYIHLASVYDESPDALRKRYPAGTTRAGEHAWWFLSQTRFQSQAPGGGANKRADRTVGAAGYWRLEQSRTRLAADGHKNSFGFYTGPSKSKDKSPWLMQEFTSAHDSGAGKRGVPALHRVYVTPRATDDELRDIFGEHGVLFGPDGKKKPARAMVPHEYFDGIAALLPHGSVRGVALEHDAPQQAAAPGQEGQQYLGQYQQQEEGQYLGQYQQQEEGQYHGQYQHQEEGQYHGQYQQQEEGQYHGQYQQQEEEEQYHGQHQQQEEEQYHGQYTMEGASQADIFGQPSDDNLTMSMDEFMGIVNGEPTAETAKGEPNWGSLEAIVADDEFADFNNDG